MVLNSRFKKSVFLACALLLSGCDWHTDWSAEYHQRQFEEFRVMGDRARVGGDFKTAAQDYQKALTELKQTRATQMQMGRALEDLAEAELLANEFQLARKDFDLALRSLSGVNERAGLVTSTKTSTDSSLLSVARCQVGCAVTALKLHQNEEALSFLNEAEKGYSTAGKASEAYIDGKIACGWMPPLCRHSIKYWKALCSGQDWKDSSARKTIETILSDHDSCLSVKQLAAKSFHDILLAENNKTAARKLEESYGLPGNADSPESIALQRRWEAISKKGKALDEQGDKVGAVQSFEDALTLSTRPGYDYPLRHMTSLCNLAFSFLSQNKFDLALPLLQECVDLQASRFGENDRGLAIPRVRLGKTLLSLGQTERAEYELKRGYELALHGYGKESPFTARAESALAALELEKKEWSKSKEYAIHALAILEKDPLRNELAIISTRCNLAKACCESGESDASLQEAKNAVEFALSHGAYWEQVEAIQNLISICKKFKRSAEEESAARQEWTVLNEALNNLKWHKWAVKLKAKLEAEYPRLKEDAGE